MKYLYILVAMFFMGCSVNSPEVKKASEVKTKVEVVEVAQVGETRKDVKSVVSNNQTLVEEKKVTQKIGTDIPTSCAMWSDGCNVCTRVGNGKASCTTNPECTHKMFSCLQWQ